MESYVQLHAVIGRLPVYFLSTIECAYQVQGEWYMCKISIFQFEGWGVRNILFSPVHDRQSWSFPSDAFLKWLKPSQREASILHLQLPASCLPSAYYLTLWYGGPDGKTGNLEVVRCITSLDKDTGLWVQMPLASCLFQCQFFPFFA